MSTGSAERAFFSVTDVTQINDKSPRGISEREKKLRLSVNFRPVNLKHLLAYIDKQDFDPELKAALRKKASSYPHTALQRFADNFEQMVSAAQRGLRKTYTVEPVLADLNAAQTTPVQPKLEPVAVIVAKKIDLTKLEYEDSPSDLLKTPVESLEGVPASVNVKKEEEKKPKEQPKPKPRMQAMPQVFSASLRPEDFE